MRKQYKLRAVDVKLTRAEVLQQKEDKLAQQQAYLEELQQRRHAPPEDIERLQNAIESLTRQIAEMSEEHRRDMDEDEKMPLIKGRERGR